MLLSTLACLLLLAFPAIQGASLEVVDSKNVFTCFFCRTVVNDVFRGFDNGETDEQIASGIGNTCGTFNIYTYQTCYGTALLALPTVRYMYTNTTLGLVQGNICGIALQLEGCGFENETILEWSINPSSVPKPPVVEPPPPPAGSPTLKVLHLADIHWDPEYLEGSNAACSDALCCRNSSGFLILPSDAAGYWGDYRTCDLPWRTVDKAMAHMAQTHPDIDYIVWTGDLIPHDVYETDQAENLGIIDQLMAAVQRYFPGVPLYPTLGNHEAHPVNTFAPPEITDPEWNTVWLYDSWTKWLPNDTSVTTTVHYGGYYTTLVKPGLRVISTNMNYCYTYNWWTLYKSQDPASQLLWLNQVLEDAERAGEKVHILSHIPPGNGDCWTIFSREFAKIINRFESTVAAQFYGHTHTDEYKLFYDSVETDRAINVAFVAPSLTTYSDLNPGYRVYTVDGERPGSTFEVLDFTSYIFNLTEANIQGSGVDPVWFELYTATQEYGLTDLRPQSLSALHQRLLTDDALFGLYYKNWAKASDVMPIEGCDIKCRAKHLCYIVTTDPKDTTRCNQVHEKLLSQAR